MKLERARELYSDYAEGTLTPAMKLALEQHFDADAEARADYDEFARIFAVLGDSAPVDIDVPLGFRAKVMELATAEQERRASAPRSLGDAIREWFAPSGRRRLSGGLLAGVAALVVAGVVFNPAINHPGTTPGTMFPGINTPAPDATPLMIQGVSTGMGTDGNFYHYFHIHLPQNVQSATVNAFVVTSSDQITDPAIRASDAHLALSAPMTLSNDEEMQIPVARAKRPEPGATLDMLVNWQSDSDPSHGGSQVVFTPFDVSDGGPATPPTANGNFYDTLRAIASVYHVTVIADATSSPTVAAAGWTSGDDVSKALNTVAGSVSYGVRKLNDTTYQVFDKR
ncbi:hypothetical protein CCAX7_20410 [Capsulimonas corticalis]|uniref:Uncharacterized protein n=1 Tax=Capsulimonas corticalis TaxID=2219043 RepID=A0A402D2J2_9BACT|nr:hypothetical protein [Capsulimonas corticalis]BDI29990.1 hypothetical protein CCAX7_20410 [Capsulimonas corticalis]